MPQTANFVAGNRIEASTYGITVYNSFGNTLFFVSPLNDYFYQDSVKEHIQNKIATSNDGNLLQKTILSIEDPLFNTKSLVWNANGVNSKGKVSENFTVKSFSNKVEVIREIVLSSAQANAIGQVISICSDCLVVDDKSRAYFNGDLITTQKLDNAARLHLTPVLVSKNQAFSLDSLKMSVLSAEGKVQMELVMPKKGEMFLQDEWHLIELKIPITKNSNPKITQEIFIPK